MNILIEYTVTVVDDDWAYQVGSTCGGTIDNGDDATQPVAEMFRESLEDALGEMLECTEGVFK